MGCYLCWLMAMSSFALYCGVRCFDGRGMTELAPPIRMLHISDAQRRRAAMTVAQLCDYDCQQTQDVLLALGLAAVEASGRVRSMRDEDGQHWWAGSAREAARESGRVAESPVKRRGRRS